MKNTKTQKDIVKTPNDKKDIQYFPFSIKGKQSLCGLSKNVFQKKKHFFESEFQLMQFNKLLQRERIFQ